MTDKVCNLTGQFQIQCEGDERESKCCCFNTGWVTLNCDAEPDDLIAALDNLPPFSVVSAVVNFGNDGWVLIYKTPLPGTCDDGTTPPGTGG